MWTTKKGKKDGQPRQKKTNMGLYVNAIKPGSMQEFTSCCNCAAKKPATKSTSARRRRRRLPSTRRAAVEAAKFEAGDGKNKRACRQSCRRVKPRYCGGGKKGSDIVSNAALVSVTSRLVSVPEATKSDSERKTDSAPQPLNAGGSDGASA